jgi:superfamily I DNA/RNA helicase
MAERGLAPRDYVVLVKQRADQFEAELAPRFEEAGLRLRNEAGQLGRTTLQDLLADHAARLAANLLRLGAAKQAPRAYEAVTLALRDLRGIPQGDDRRSQALDRELSTRIKQLRLGMAQVEPCEAEAEALAQLAFGYLDLAALRRTYPEYRSGDLLDIMVEAFGLHLGACSSAGGDWNSILDRFEGVGQIPLMTVHKSKGLEFDTTIFVGLDDRAWWSHVPGDPESVAAFFVALSRAKQRAIFAFCQGRGRRNRVADLFQLLTDAGVPEIQI